ncbi:MAG TPA: glycoside hydrolase family 140 protein [Tepidisphaeraceae bacterium]|nr:glycoside hydrolase family 140 protein [Tepidisphaeraceae bacterium]
MKICQRVVTLLVAVAFGLMMSASLEAQSPAQGELRPALPLKASEDGRHLVDQQNRPFLYSADTAWLLFYRLSEQEAVEYMTKRQAQGFNAIQVMLAVELDTTSIDGQKPFIDEDFARPNEVFFSHVDRVVERAEEKGLVLPIAPIWAGTGDTGWAGKKDGHLLPMKVNGPEKCRKLGQYLGTRYGKHKHLMWIMGGDDDPQGEREEYRQLAMGLKDKAPHQLITYHAASTHSSSDVWAADEPWLDVVMTYTYFRGFNKAWTKNQPDVYEANYKEYGKSPVRPFFLGESTYEGEHGEWGSALQARKNAYWSVLSGGTGHAYGSPNWHLPADWRKIIDSPGANSLRHFRDLFASRPWHLLVPDEKNEVATAGQGRFASNDYATTAVASDGSFSMTYMPSRRKLTMDLSRLSGKQVQAWWFNPRTGQVSNAGVYQTTGVRQFEPREEGDWVLVLEEVAKNFGPLGASARQG